MPKEVIAGLPATNRSRSSESRTTESARMAKNITHFMWGYQSHFRSTQKVSAAHLFKLLDDRFEPEVFLVGILHPEALNESVPACVEPEDDYWAKSEDFDRTLESSAPLREAYPEAKGFHSHPLAQQYQDDDLFRRSIRDAMQALVENHPEKQPDTEYFVSVPQRVESYLVSVILGLQQSVLISYYRLSRASVPLHEHRDVPVSRSLLDAAVAEFLGNAAEELRKPNAGFGSLHRDPEEVVRAAGRRLMGDAAYRVDDSTYEWENLFRSCATISSLKYEKGVGVGGMVIAREGHPAIETRVQFTSDLRLGNFRWARKLLQLAAHGSGLHSNGARVFGLVEVEGYSSENEDLFEVRFIDHHHWALTHDGNVLMRVRYGQPYLTKPPTYEAKLPQDLPRLFENITDADVHLLVSLVRTAENESHGTLLVITPKAEAEARRLKGQAIVIQSQQLTPEILGQLTSIDGAVMIDPSGYFHALGVILDGIASDEGDSARGARYNSALRYVSYQKSLGTPCLAVVVSEDGGVDLVPDLRPAIERSSIDHAIGSLESIARDDHTPWLRYQELLDWLSKRRFYLLEEDCTSINRSVAAIEERANQEDPMIIRIVRSAFVTNLEMDSKLYYI